MNKLVLLTLIAVGSVNAAPKVDPTGVGAGAKDTSSAAAAAQTPQRARFTVRNQSLRTPAYLEAVEAEAQKLFQERAQRSSLEGLDVLQAQCQERIGDLLAKIDYITTSYEEEKRSLFRYHVVDAFLQKLKAESAPRHERVADVNRRAAESAPREVALAEAAHSTAQAYKAAPERLTLEWIFRKVRINDDVEVFEVPAATPDRQDRTERTIESGRPFVATPYPHSTATRNCRDESKKLGASAAASSGSDSE